MEIVNNNMNDGNNNDGDTKKKPPAPKLPCPHCSKQYTKYYLPKHIQNTHGPESADWITCGLDGCQKKYKDEAAVERHQKQSSTHRDRNARTQIESACPRCEVSVLKKSIQLRQVFCSSSACSYNHRYIGDNAVYPYKNN